MDDIESFLQDRITDDLLTIHRSLGFQKVQETLRLAIVNYAAECNLPPDATDDDKAAADPDYDIIDQLSLAVVTPIHEQAPHKTPTA